MLFVCVKNYPYPLLVAGGLELVSQFLPNPEIFFQREAEECYLDPGGMLCTQTPILWFEFGKLRFAVKADQIDRMLDLWGRAKISGNIVIVDMWMKRLLLAKDIYDQLHTLLREAHRSDAALNAELMRNDLLVKLYEKGVIFKPKD